MDRISAIRKSLTAFVCGLLAFLPIFGVVPAVYALVCWGRVHARYRNGWNPASLYLNWGAVLAALGLLASFFLIVAALLAYFGQFN